MSFRRLALISMLMLVAQAPLSRAGTLGVYEGSVSPGSFLVLPGPVTGRTLDVDYDSLSAEGGGVFGLSEVTFFATGGVTFDSTGFSCDLPGCFVAPELFVGGQEFRVTGGDDINGEFSIGSNFITVRISGNSGYVGVSKGQYLDATSPGPSIGNIQSIDLGLIARVPEPNIALGLSLGAAALFARARHRRLGRA